MVPKLSEEQRTALEQQIGQPVYVVDTVKRISYVLIPAETYHRVRALFEPEFDVRDTYAAQEQALAQAGWNDPAMDAYNDYDAHFPPQ